MVYRILNTGAYRAGVSEAPTGGLLIRPALGMYGPLEELS